MARRSTRLVAITAVLALCRRMRRWEEQRHNGVTCRGGIRHGRIDRGGSSKTITVGVMTDISGPAASGEAHIEDGVKAGV